MSTDPDELITSAQAAEILGVSRPTTSRWMEIGVLEAAIVFPGYNGPRLFKRGHVEQLAADLAARGLPRRGIRGLRQALEADVETLEAAS